MKRKSQPYISNAPRCQHRTPTGRQCCLLASDANSGLCARHAALQPPEPTADFAMPLTRDAYRFQNAQGINHSLGTLYTLLAQDRISPRRAAVLAYISSLLLRSLTAIDNDLYPHSGKPPAPDITIAAEVDDDPDAQEPHPDAATSDAAPASQNPVDETPEFAAEPSPPNLHAPAAHIKPN